jgi:hypothetical protein
MEGILSKMNREGKFEAKYFVLTKETLGYSDLQIAKNQSNDTHKHVMELTNLISL